MDRHGVSQDEVWRLRVQERLPNTYGRHGLLDQLKFNRAVEVYLAQIPAVAIFAEHRGLGDFGAKRSNQLVVWENLMDATTILLTANTETVYALGHLDLKSEGPTVVEAPPKMLGFAMDALQRYLVDIGPLGPDKGNGGKYLFSPARALRSNSARILRRQVADLHCRLWSPRLQGGRQDRSGGCAHEADQDLPSGEGVQPAKDGVFQRFR